MEELVYELNQAAARLAREAADELERRDRDAPRFVAGVLGPTNRDRVALAGRERSRLPERDVRRAGRDLRARARAA